MVHDVDSKPKQNMDMEAPSGILCSINMTKENTLAELEENNYTPGAYFCSMFNSIIRGNSVTQDILGHESIFLLSLRALEFMTQ